MSGHAMSHADTIRHELLTYAPEAEASLDALLAENQRLRRERATPHRGADAAVHRGVAWPTDQDE